jgi:uncharacterized membrane protein (DUF485 family)
MVNAVEGGTSMKTKVHVNHFKKYIKAFDPQSFQSNENGYKEYARAYMKDKGFDEFTLLVRELEAIESEEEWEFFESVASDNYLMRTRSGLKELSQAAIRLFQYYQSKDSAEKTEPPVLNSRVIPQNPMFSFMSSKKKSQTKFMGILYLTLGCVLVIITAYMLLTDFFAHKHSSAKFVFGMIAIMGMILIISGIAYLRTEK